MANLKKREMEKEGELEGRHFPLKLSKEDSRMGPTQMNESDEAEEGFLRGHREDHLDLSPGCLTRDPEAGVAKLLVQSSDVLHSPQGECRPVSHLE